MSKAGTNPTTPADNIFLLGFMGVGKSTVGAALARLLGWKFQDLDKLIVERAGRSIREIFETQGEEKFRELESLVLWDHCQAHHQVIALGGGAWMREENRVPILSNGAEVYLRASEDTLMKRLHRTASNRPLLHGGPGGDLRKKIRELLEQRQPFYEKARYKLDTDGRSPEEIARQILAELPVQPMTPLPLIPAKDGQGRKKT